jgi:hypothetical protein
MSKQRERELRQLIHLKTQLIENNKKELKKYRNELQQLESQKRKI